jgi:large subunit ribosomal protein L12
VEYIYGALMLHAAGKKIDEASLEKVLESAGVNVDKPKVKSLIASLKNVDIDEVLAQKAVAPVAEVAEGKKPAEEKVEKKEGGKKEEKEEEEEAAAGLGALFG